MNYLNIFGKDFDFVNTFSNQEKQNRINFQSIRNRNSYFNYKYQNNYANLLIIASISYASITQNQNQTGQEKNINNNEFNKLVKSDKIKKLKLKRQLFSKPIVQIITKDNIKYYSQIRVENIENIKAIYNNIISDQIDLFLHYFLFIYFIMLYHAFIKSFFVKIINTFNRENFKCIYNIKLFNELSSQDQNKLLASRLHYQINLQNYNSYENQYDNNDKQKNIQVQNSKNLTGL